jgi:hypothetical protein
MRHNESGLCPEPRDLALCYSKPSKTKEGNTAIAALPSASSPARRSGCFPAEPYPPNGQTHGNPVLTAGQE